jgi:hypothetical protein
MKSFIFNYLSTMTSISYTDIESIVYDFNGIIYGGYIRDMMIRKYYSDCYYSNGYDKINFDNIKFAKSLSKRMIKPNDMDIYFKSSEIAINFIEELSTFGDILKKINNDFTYTGIYSLIQHKQITLLLPNGNELAFDISYPYKNTEEECKELEPPFNNLDMLCNGFIMDKNGIRYSTTTGTYMDDLNIHDRKKEIVRITLDIYECKTELTTYGGLKIEEPYIVGRVIKMMNRKFGWTITNTPFTFTHKCFTCCKCNEISNKGFTFAKKSYDKECFYEKLYNCEFKRELHLKIDGEIIAFI